MNLRFSNSAFAARHSAAPARRRPAPPLSSGVWPPASGVWRLASGVCLLASLLWLPAPVLAAGGGADYGRGPETDPVATAALVSVYAATSALNAAVKTVQARTSTWEQAATDASSATGDVAVLQGEMLDVQAQTSTWNQAATDASSATSDVAVLTGYFGALGETSIVFTSTLQTNTFWFNAQGILTNHVQEGP